MLETTPGLLIKGEEIHYLEKFKDIFNDDNKIILPEKNNKPVFIFTDKESSIYHIWRGGGYAGLKEDEFNFNDPQFYRRAQRILWIKYLLENPQIRHIYRDKNNGYFCFVSNELEYSVVIKEAKTSFVLITAYHTYNTYGYMSNEKRFERVYSI